MDYRNRRELKAAARDSLAAAPGDSRKLILIHTAVTVAVSLIGTLINYLLGLQIENTGGLTGVGMRSTLSAIQSFLQVIVAIALPFWEAGLIYSAIRIFRKQRTDASSLLEGFRRFGPLLRSKLLMMLIYFGIGIVAFFLSMQIFMMTPLSNALVEILSDMQTSSVLTDASYVMDEATMLALQDAYTPLILIFLVVFLLGMLFVSYRFRMMDYLILDNPGMGALAAMRSSRIQMRDKKMALFKLDLSFWWFYLLQSLFSLLVYGDYLLEIFGVEVPLSADALYFGFLVLSLACQFCLYYFARNRVEVTYAAFYDCTMIPTQKESDASRRNPWQS